MDDAVSSLEFYDKLKIYRAQTPVYDGVMKMAGASSTGMAVDVMFVQGEEEGVRAVIFAPAALVKDVVQDVNRVVRVAVKDLA